ncbi:MAG TPA: SufD family Fe-S cluster assembly protein [Candidatus Limnocylindrales bacterium]|nr:SufD family Fe-S cluster assembly protein [Candidatus Limnocylindrales bacterium]
MTAPVARPRPARRALDVLSLSVDETALQAHAARDPDWLTTDRRAAFDAWSSLPAETNMLYTPYIDLRAAQLETAALITVPDPDRPDGSVPAEAAALLEITDGAVTTAALSDDATAAGITLTDLRGLLTADPARVQRLLAEGPGLAEDDKFAQLTRAAWAQGAVVDVPDGVQLDRPIVIRWAIGAPDTALLTRTLVRVGAGARVSIVEEFVPSAATDVDAEQGFFAGSMEVTVGDGASLQVASLQELPANVVAIQHRVADIGEGATLQWALAQLGGRLVRSRVDNRLVGDRSSVEQVEIVFGADAQLFDLTSYTTHIGKDTTGDLLSKAALLEKSRTYLKGLITIERSANGTDSFLGEFGMNLSKDARSVAIPSLEIDQPDCRRAMHSSSVGPVDETQLFYLESRGIPPDEARKFIVLGFLEPVVARVPLASAQDRLRDLLEAKWIAGTDGIAGEAAA